MCEIIYHTDYNKYFLGKEHPFDPRRIEMVIDLLNELNILKEPIKPSGLSPENLLSVHGKEYIDAVEAASRGVKDPGFEQFGLGTLDNPVIEGMAEGARIQAGGTVLGARLIIENKANKVLQLGGGFHHARRNSAEGFCLYNDLALAINELTAAGMNVVYLDIDVHHSDGVQEIFYDSDKVMTISVHESGEYLFPGTGWIHELGRGSGRSLKLNLPLEPFTEGDSYLEVIESVITKALVWYRPNALVVQAGADAHFSDPLADLMLTTQDYERIFKKLVELAENHCGGKILFTLGGGYSITAAPRIWIILYCILTGHDIPENLPLNWRLRWEEKIGKKLPELLSDPESPFKPIPRKNEIERHNRELIRRISDAVAPYWI